MRLDRRPLHVVQPEQARHRPSPAVWQGESPRRTYVNWVQTLDVPPRDLSPAQEAQVGALVLIGAWARAVPPDARTTSGFFAVRNTGTIPDRLVSAWSGDAELVQLRERDPTSATAFRRATEGFPLSPGGALTLEPGGPHLELTGLRKPLGAGDRVRVALRFEVAGDVTIELRGHDH